MRKIYYKVIDGDTRNSIIMGNELSLRVNYPIKQWVKPVLEGSKLFVFKHLYEASCFSRNELLIYRYPKVVKCYVKNPSKSETLPIKVASSAYEELQELWDSYNKIKKNHKKMDLIFTQYAVKSAPIGTVFVMKYIV